MRRERRWLVAVGWLVACAPTAAPADAAIDVLGLACTATLAEVREACGRPLGPVATECSPDGEGWCCPYGVSSSSDRGCYPFTGGFVRSPCECASGHTVCDIPASAWGMRLDEHGCPTLEVRLPMECVCLCPPKIDAGSGDALVPLDAGLPDAP